MKRDWMQHYRYYSYYDVNSGWAMANLATAYLVDLGIVGEGVDASHPWRNEITSLVFNTYTLYNLE